MEFLKLPRPKSASEYFMELGSDEIKVCFPQLKNRCIFRSKSLSCQGKIQFLNLRFTR